MKDLVILSGIIIFWFLLVSTLTMMEADPLIQSLSAGGNSSYSYESDTASFNVTGDTPDSTRVSSFYRFIRMAFKMFTFSIPHSAGMPSILRTGISFLNWFLFLMGGLIIYRLLRSGGG